MVGNRRDILQLAVAQSEHPVETLGSFVWPFSFPLWNKTCNCRIDGIKINTSKKQTSHI